MNDGGTRCFFFVAIGHAQDHNHGRRLQLREMEGIGAQRQRALVIALLVSLVLWNLPMGGLLLYPFKLLATWIHEMSHGLVMLATGAGFDYMDIYRDTSGLSYAKEGVSVASSAAIASAGYLGTPAWGALLLALGQSRRGARSMLALLGLGLALSALLFLRNDFGIIVTVIGACVFIAAALFASESVASLLLNFVAAQLCVNAVLDIRVLYRSNLVVNGEIMGNSDAHNMAAASVGSPWMWATIWMLWSFVMFYVSLRWAYLEQNQKADQSPASSGRTDSSIAWKAGAKSAANASGTKQ